MKKLLKKLNLIIISLLMIFSHITPLYAASATISVSSSASSVVVGNTFTVTYKISSSSALGSWEFTPSYDTSKFKLTSGSASVVDYASNSSTKSRSYTYKFKAIATGSGKITVKSYAAYAYDESKMSISAGSKTVKVISASEKKASYSKNNDLKALSIDGLTLTPAFAKGTTSYKAEANANTTSIKINATKDDSKASVSGDGTHEVEEGENKFEVVVTAENGSKKTYTIVVNVVDPNPIEITIGDNTLVVVKREKKLPKIENFELSKATIKEQEVPCLYNQLNEFTLIGLKDKDGKVDVYLYDKEKDTFTLYEDASLSTMNIFPLEIEDDYKTEYKRTELKIDDVTFNALKTNISGLYIIKARDLLKAEDNYYEYDEKTNTLIRYMEDEVKEKEHKKEIQKYKKIIAILGAETVIIIIVLVCILISRVRKNKLRKKQIEEQKKKHEELQEEIKKSSIKEKKKTKKKEVLKNEEEKNSKSI